MRRVLALVTASAVAMALFVPAAGAAGHEFEVNVYHGINGRSLGLSKALPVVAEVQPYSAGCTVPVGGTIDIPLEFKDRFSAELEPGCYAIAVFSVELGDYIDSMAVGPVDIPGGVTVNLHAKKAANKTPILKVKVK